MFTLATLVITTDILGLIAAIDEFKGAWRALGTLAPERLSALRKVASIESIGSSTRIEGSRLTDRQVETLLSNLSIKSFASRDEQEVAGYAEVMETIFQSWKSIRLDENHIRQLHRDLLKYSDKDERHRGKYKTSSNSVAAFDADGKQVGIVFETAAPFATPGLVSELVKWTNEAFEEKRPHPLLVIAIFTVVFLEIHPFQDGNGRLSRILTALLLLRAGYVYAPYSSLESIIEQNKEEYYLALRQTQTTIRSKKANWQPWVVFFLTALHKQTLVLEKKMEREQLLLASMPELSLQILEHAKNHGRVTIGEMAKLTGVSRNTLKTHFRQLEKDGGLLMHGAGRGIWYSLGIIQY
ncbi:MAG: Fic family protein [Planctomycetota bacterium]|jgi:Fic family protein|nr:Fic family protein [Planctomycetota bacterium]